MRSLFIRTPIPAGGFEFEQGSKPPALAYQIIRRAHFQNAPVLQHDHPVSRAGGGQAMGDGQDGALAAGRFLLQGLAEGGFAGAVDGLGGFIK